MTTSESYQDGLLSTEAFGRSAHEKETFEQRSEMPLPLVEEARVKAYVYIKARLEKTDTHVTFDLADVYVVWFSKVLQNWKALASTTLPDGMYYEITYNGDKRETYVDAYKKFDNLCIPDED